MDKIIRIIVAVLPYIVIGVLCIFLSQTCSKLDRIESNYQQQNKPVQTYSLTKKELKEYLDRVLPVLKDSIVANMKVKQVSNIVTSHVHYHTDTNIVIKTEDKQGKQYVNFNDGCLSYEGYFKDYNYTHLKGGFRSDKSIVTYWERPQLFKRVTWIKHPFKKVYSVKQFGQCEDTVTITNIDVKKLVR